MNAVGGLGAHWFLPIMGVLSIGAGSRHQVVLTISPRGAAPDRAPAPFAFSAGPSAEGIR